MCFIPSHSLCVPYDAKYVGDPTGTVETDFNDS